MIKAEVYNQTIKLNCERVASDSVKYLKIKFLVGADWDGAVKTAVFKNDEQNISVSVILEEGNDLYLGDNTCYVPFEVIKPPCFSVSINGLKGDTLITTLPERIRVYQSGVITADEAGDYTPTQYEQLLGIYEETKEIAQSVRNDADNGVFNGEKGKDAVTDFEYNPESENAQSGKAVAEALSGLSTVFAPVIKQKVSGNTLAINDMAFTEQELKLKAVKVNHFDVTKVTEQSGVVSINADNTLSITPPSSSLVILGKLTDICSGLSGGDIVTIYYNSTGAKNGFGLQYTNVTSLGQAENNTIINCFINQNTTVVLPDDISNVYVYYIALGETNTRTLSNISITKGEMSPITVTQYGKNLCDNVFEEGSINGTSGVNEANITAARTKNYIPILPITVYTMTNPIASANQKTRFYDKDKKYIGYSMGTYPNFISKDNNNLIVTSTTPANAYYMRFEINFDSSLSIDERKALVTAMKNGKYLYQFESGAIATEYEPCDIKTATANADGTVEGVTAVRPSMTLVVDNSAVLECEYLADTKLYIDNKIAAIK